MCCLSAKEAHFGIELTRNITLQVVGTHGPVETLPQIMLQVAFSHMLFLVQRLCNHLAITGLKVNPVCQRNIFSQHSLYLSAAANC